MTQPPHSVEGAPGRADGAILNILHTLIRERAAAHEAAQKRDERREARDDERERRQAARDARLEDKIDSLTAKVDHLEADNRRQDRVQAHDGAVAEEALTMAAAKTGGRHGGLWGAAAAIAVTALTTIGAIVVEWIKTGGPR